jgi:hypothetical protein
MRPQMIVSVLLRLAQACANPFDIAPWSRGDAVPQLFEAEWGLLDDTRQTVFPTSSAISNPPLRSTAKPTGRPRA